MSNKFHISNLSLKRLPHTKNFGLAKHFPTIIRAFDIIIHSFNLLHKPIDNRIAYAKCGFDEKSICLKLI